MKAFIFFVSLSVCTLIAKGQNVYPGQLRSVQIAKKMKDTLSLSPEQYRSIYQANLSLLNRKTLVRQRYTNRDSLTVYIQRVENKRDSFYQTILNPSQYNTYKLKKNSLISAQ